MKTLYKRDVFSFGDKILFKGLFSMGLILSTVFGLFWFQSSHIPQNFSGSLHVLDIALFIVLSYVVWYQIINELFSWFTASSMKHPRYIAPYPGKKVAFLTAFVPGKEPYDVLEKALKAMVEVDYPHETWLLDEGNDDEAKRLCALYGVKHYTRKGIAKYNTEGGLFKAKTKAGNYNSWYDQFGKNYEFVAQIDVDFIPKKNFLIKTLGYFQDAQVAFVGSPQIYGNKDESWIARAAAEQAYNFYGSMQKGFFGSDMQLFIGANHVVRVAAHNTIDGYSGHIVEDHLTGMKFYAKGWKSVYVPEILAVGEGPTTWDAYFSQQMRWAYGLIDILFTQSPKLFGKMKLKHALNYFLLQQYYFYGIAQVLGIVLLTLYFVFGVQSTQMELKGLLPTYIPLLVIQQVIFLWLQKFNVDPKNESGLMLRSRILNCAAWPIYFVALVGVIRRKRLTYKVTPKGSQQDNDAQLALFVPHLVLGSLTLIDIIFSFSTHHQSIQLIFWAWMNTIVMYYFVLNEGLKKIAQSVPTIEWKLPSFASLRKIQNAFA